MENQNTFTITCNKCGRSLLIDKDLIGKKTLCPSCQNEMVIPPSSDFTSKDNNNVKGKVQEQAKWKSNLRLIATGIQFIIFIFISIKSGGGLLSVINFFIAILLFFSKGSIFRCLFFVGSWIYIASFIRLANQGGQITVCLFAGFIESILIAISIRNADLWKDNYKVDLSDNSKKKDMSIEIKRYYREAELGNASAQFHLGLSYQYGNGVEKDMTKAVEWYHKSADQGHPMAQYYLGLSYENGDGVPKDMTKAVEWYRKAAEQGNAKAQYNLGNCYFGGKGIKMDLSKAMEWWRMAAAQGDADAKKRLQELGY